MRSLTLALSVLTFTVHAQPFAIGSMQMDFYDADRDRDIPCEVYYPAATAGEDVPVSDGSFPVIGIGHGFVMSVDAYTYLWQHYVPLGYIVLLPTTEGGFAPDHEAFGTDLAFLVNALVAAGDDDAGAFYQHVSPATVLMGHSMGGGAAFLGAAGNAGLKALITFAPAETDPSAVAAAALVQAPALVFAATEDCVTPIPDHQGPMYAALTVPCKAFVNITGGGHCFFGDDSFTCSFGEITCGPDLTITREEQHDVVTDITDLWLALHVQQDDAALAPLLDSLATSSRFIAETTCLSTLLADITNDPDDRLSAVLAGNRLLIRGCTSGDRLVLIDAIGRTCWSARSDGSTIEAPCPDGTGTFIVRAWGDGPPRACRFVVPH